MSKPRRRAPRALPPVTPAQRAQQPFQPNRPRIDPRLEASARLVISQLLEMYPALQAVNIQLIFQAEGVLHTDTQVGLDPRCPVQPAELLKMFAVSLAAQSPQIRVEADFSAAGLPAPPQWH